MRTRFYSLLLLAASLATLAFVASSVLEDSYFREWRRHQRGYAKLTEGKTPFEPGLKQYYLPHLNRIDRCTTCHAGLLNPEMGSAAQPHTGHPGNYLSFHQPQEFGCTVCHAGQGLATNSAEAHASDPDRHVFWDEPVYSKEFTQASCRTCHSSAWAAENGAPLLGKGAKLFVDLGCNSCHKTGGVGGSRGPALDGLGSQPRAHFSMAHLGPPRTVERWQVEHLKNPQRIVPGSAMSQYGLSDEDAKALAIYILSLRDIPVPERMTHSRDTMDRDKPDGRLLYQRNCSGCHGEGLKDREDKILGWRIPAIRNPEMLAIAGPDFLRKAIEQGREGTPMESWSSESSGLSKAEIHALVAYLYSNAAREKPKPWTFSDTADPEEGKALFEDSCKQCHSASGQGGPKGPSLTGRTLMEMPDSFLAITVRDGRPGTSMDSFKEEAEFTDQEIADVVAFVRELQEKASSPR